MKALVISGGGSKGAFAGGVAQFLIEEAGRKYDIFVGTSTGSLLLSHLALGKIEKIRSIYSSVTNDDIFSSHPFRIRKKYGEDWVSINHLNVVKRFFNREKTFGESRKLRELIGKSYSHEEFNQLKESGKEVVVTVANLTMNRIEYKSIKDFDYEEFLDWTWISANYAPFMSVVRKNSYEYADGGLGSLVPIEEAIRRGAREVDVIVLRTEVNSLNRLPSRNPFELTTNVFSFVMDRIENQNIRIGKMVAIQQDVILNFYYTPTVLTTNSLIFNPIRMERWWKRGYLYAKNKQGDEMPVEPNLKE